MPNLDQNLMHDCITISSDVNKDFSPRTRTRTRTWVPRSRCRTSLSRTRTMI